MPLTGLVDSASSLASAYSPLPWLLLASDVLRDLGIPWHWGACCYLGWRQLHPIRFGVGFQGGLSYQALVPYSEPRIRSIGDAHSNPWMCYVYQAGSAIHTTKFAWYSLTPNGFLIILELLIFLVFHSAGDSFSSPSMAIDRLSQNH